jgi:hypothetical protein
MFKKAGAWACRSSSVVEHSLEQPKVEGLSLAANAAPGKEKRAGKRGFGRGTNPKHMFILRWAVS